MKYKSLNDAAKNREVENALRQFGRTGDERSLFAPGDVRIWYYRSRQGADHELSEHLVDLGMGSRWLEQQGRPFPSPKDIGRTHVRLGSIHGPDVPRHRARTSKYTQGELDEIFMLMQGEIWSPRGEANSLIRGLGLGHTSMSVGDIIQPPDGSLWFVDSVGFKRIWPTKNPRRRAKPRRARKNPDGRAILRRLMRGT